MSESAASGTGPRKALQEALAKQAAEIRVLEAAADNVLHGQGDTEQYKARLEHKAELLSALPDQVAHLIRELAAGERERVEEGLQTFARNAEQALSVDSVFFMRQLLYPEDYQEGQDNDLERFIRGLGEA